MPDGDVSRHSAPTPSPARGHQGRYRTSRLLVAIGVALIVGSFVATAAVLWQLRGTTVSRAEADLRRFASVLAEQTASMLRAVDLALSTLEEHPRAEADDHQKLHNELRPVMASIAQLQNMFMADAAGKVVVSARSHPPPRVAVGDREYFKAHQSGLAGPLFSPTLRNRVDGRWSIVISRRLMQRDGTFDGVIAADIDPGYLARFYAAMDLGYGAAVSFADRDGTLLARYPWVDAVGQRMPGSEMFAARVAAASTGTFRAQSPFDGATRLHGYAAVDSYPLVMVTAADIEVVLAPWRETVAMTGASVLLADGVIVALIALVVIQIRRRERSEARFRDFAGAASDWYWETGAELRFTYVSRVGRDGSVGGRHEAIGQCFRDVLLDLPGDETLRRLEADLSARVPFRDALCQIRTTYGRVRHLNLSGQPHFDESGAFLGYRGVARDITPEVEARSASAQANMRFLHAIETSSDGISFWDAQDRFVLCNQRYRYKIGRIGDRLVPGVTFEHFIWEGIRRGEIKAPPGKAAEIFERRMACHRAATGEPIELEYGDGWRLVRDQRTPDGGTLVIWTDITALKRKDAELRAAQHDATQARQQFYMAIENSYDGFALWDADDRLVLCNRKYRERAHAAAALLVPGVTFEEFLREGSRLSEMTAPGLDPDGVISRRIELHRRASGEPLEVIRGGCRHVVRDQRMPDGGCLVISTELRTAEDAVSANAADGSASR